MKPTPVATPTSTPERLKLIDGEIDACLLINSEEFEAITGIKAIGESWFANPYGAASCTYGTETDSKVSLIIFVTTDATLKRVHETSTAEDRYNIFRRGELSLPKLYTVEDINDLGNQAYFSNRSDFNLAIRVLNNEIFYEFNAFNDGTFDRDILIQLAKTALQRAP
jgi:hypothetical protein